MVTWRLAQPTNRALGRGAVIFARRRHVVSIVLGISAALQAGLPSPPSAIAVEPATSTTWAWGQNNNRELGTDATDSCLDAPYTTPCSTTPVSVAGLDGVVDLEGGRWHSVALRDDGTVWTWG